MAEEVSVNVWCDVHLDRDEKIPARRFKLGADIGLRTVDLCESCEKEIYQPIEQLLIRHGGPLDRPTKPVATKPAASPDAYCPICDKNLSSRKSLQDHARQRHGVKSSEILPPLRRAAAPINGTCPECGATYDSAAKMGAHRHRAHGVAGSSAAALSQVRKRQQQQEKS